MSDNVTPFDPGRKPKRSHHKKPMVAPSLEAIGTFPADAPAILRRTKISRKQYPRYLEQAMLYMVTHLTPDLLVSIQRGVRAGRYKEMELFAKLTGMLKSEAAVVVNLQNNLAIQQNENGREIDTLVRMLDERDRKQGAIDITAVPILEQAETRAIEA